MAPHSRFNSAVQAMRDIGIPSKTVKPVLRKLLELYDDNWALIEEESYRALADAIFEQQDSQKDAKIKEEDDNERERGNDEYEHEPPRTRSRLRIEEPPSALPSSSSLSCRESPSPSKRPMLGEAPPLRRRSQLRLEEPPSSPCQFSAPRLTYNEASSSKELALEEEPLKRRSRLRSEKACGSPAVPPPTSPYVEASSFKRLASESAVSPHSPEMPVSVDGAANLSSFKRPKIEPSHVEPFPISSINDPVRCSHPNANGVLNDSGHATSPQRPSLPPVEDGNNPVQHSNPQNLQMPKLEPFVDDDDYPAVGVEVPLAVIHPSGHESAEDCANRLGDSLEALSTIYEDDDDDHNENVRNSTVPNKKKEHLTDSAPEDSLSYEIASTSLGEVKLAISCNCSHTSQDFHVPSLDVVMKLAEDRALKSYKIFGSSFSIMKLMKEICQCFLELATGAGEQQKRITTVTPEINMSKLSKDHILGASHASLDLYSTLERMLPQMPQHIALNCVNGLRRRKKVDKKDAKYGNVKAKKLKPMEFRSSSDIVIAQENQDSFSIENPLHDVSDIAKCEEKVPIPIINEVSSEPYPPQFHYIPNNIVYQNAYVNFSLARIGDEDSCSGCFGNCLLGSIPCPCARETGGEYAYTLDGLVRKEFLDEAISIYRETDKLQQFFCKECPLEKSKRDTSCKGHLVRRFIKECWSKCGCNKQCGNRVVQRGIITNLQVFFTPEGKGWGLRTFDALPRGAFVCEYVGEILTNTELYNRNSQCSGDEKHHYPVLLDADWGSEGILKDEEALCLDATHYGNVARFINHRCFDANLVEIPVEIETPDHHYYHLAFFTTREVEALEELTWDYGIDFDDAEHPVKAFQCLCGSRHCRSPKRPSRTRSRALTI
ncbi:probable inactive histone-lysine N-methyltransferase SUVR2 isoform X2 [Nymphaea colorata]|uniref:probable inactive histone-lysine N-methyltransferase SUVR2 isoform X2 n=1 Tax=Nymphaea colorata TaxID=210225 RepID=UPI00129DF551|nr:probable inactive histone-lysine N-methyltransferase SUVR2 isoform X2 [Nymphaea colorata]